MGLRQDYRFGPARIAMYVKHYHDVEISSSGVWRVGHWLGLGRLQANQCYERRIPRPKRYEKQRSGHRVQIDVKLRRPGSRRDDQEALPVHRHRGLHPAARAAHLPQSRRFGDGGFADADCVYGPDLDDVAVDQLFSKARSPSGRPGEPNRHALPERHGLEDTTTHAGARPWQAPPTEKQTPLGSTLGRCAESTERSSSHWISEPRPNSN